MSSEIFNLSGNVDVNVHNGEEKLRALERQAQNTAKAIDALEKASGQGPKKGGVQAGRTTLREAVAQSNQIAKAQIDVAKTAAKSRASAEGKIARDAANNVAKMERSVFAETERTKRTLSTETLRATERAQREGVKHTERAQRDATKAIEAAQKEQQRAIERATKESEKAQKDAQKQLDRAQKEASRNADRLRRDAERADKQSARERAKTERDTQKQIERDQKEAERQSDQMRRRMDKAYAASARARLKEERDIAREATKTERQLDGKRKERATARSQIAGDVGDGASVAGAGILAGLGAATKTAVDFDRAMRNVNSIAQLSEQQFQKLNDRVITLARDPQIRQGPEELAQGLYDIYSVGIIGNKALDALRTSAKGAAAGATDTATAVDALTGVMNANIKGATNSRQIMDALFQTVNDGKVSFPQLASVIGQTLPLLNAGGLSLQEYGGYMAFATAKSQKAEFATNNLNNLILKLASPSKEAAKAFDALGIKFGFAELKSKGFTEKMVEIIQKTKGSDDALKKLFPDQQAFFAAQTIATGKMAGYNAALDNQKKAMDGLGATQRALSKQNQGSAYEADIFAKNLKILATTTGTSLLPALNSLLKSLQPAFDWFAKLSPASRDTVVKWTALAGAGLLLAGRVKVVFEAVKLCRTAMLSLGAASRAAAAAQGAQSLATGRLDGACSILRARMVATTVATGAQTAGFWSMSTAGSGAVRGLIAAFGPWGVALAAIGATIWGVRTAIIGTRDAGTMSADALKNKWGIMADVWLRGSDALNSMSTWIDKISRNPIIDKVLAISGLSTGVAVLRSNFSTYHPEGDDAEAQSKALSRKLAKPGLGTHEKSNAFKQAHGIKIDGSHAAGLKTVPKDGYIAELHKNEAVLTAPQADKWRAEQGALKGRIEGLQDKIDARVLDRAQSHKRGSDVQLLEWRQQLRDLKRELADVNRELGESDRSTKKAAQSMARSVKAMAKSQADDLSDAGKSWHAYGERVLDDADKQIEAMKGARDAVGGLAQGIEAKLLDSGAMADRGVSQEFYARISKLEQLLSTKPLQYKYDASRRIAGDAQTRADGYDQRADKLRDSTVGAGYGGSTAPGSLSGSSSGKQVSSQLVNQIAQGLNIPSNISACANIAGKILSGIGRSLPQTNVARGLYQNAVHAGWQRINPSQMKAGDMVVWRGQRYGKQKYNEGGEKVGYHTEVADSSKTTTGSPGKGLRFSTPLHDLAHAIILRPSGAFIVPVLKAPTDTTQMPASTASRTATPQAPKAPAKSKAEAPIILPPKLVVEAPQLNSLLSMFSKRDLAEMLSKHPVEGKDNAMRRQMLQDTAKLQSVLETDAKNRGLTGDKATVWVKQVKDLLYSLANFGEKAVNDHADTKEQKETDKKKKGAYDSIFTDIDTAQKRYSMRLSGQSEEQVTATLEREATLLKRINDLKEAGYGEPEAKRLALDAQARDDYNKSQKETVEWLDAQQLSASDVNEVMGKYPSIAEAARAMSERLGAALADTGGSAKDIQDVLMDLSTDPETKEFMALAQSLKTTGAEADGMRQKYSSLLGMLKQANGEWSKRAQAETAAPLIESKKRLKEMNDDLRGRAHDAFTFNSKKRAQMERDNRIKEIEDGYKQDNLPFNHEDIARYVKKEQWLDTARGLTDGLQGMFLDTFSNVNGGFKGMCDTMLDGLTKTLQQMAQQVLTSWAMQQLFGGLMGKFGGGMGTASVSLKGGGASLGNGFGLHSAPITLNGSHAKGLDVVPFNGYVGKLHAGEAVLNAQAAEAWRRSEKQKNAATAASAASSGMRQSAASGGIGDSGTHYHISGPITIQANNTKEFERELGGGSAMPRREVKRRTLKGLS